jgi:hypothetical protein
VVDVEDQDSRAAEFEIIADPGANDVEIASVGRGLISGADRCGSGQDSAGDSKEHCSATQALKDFVIHRISALAISEGQPTEIRGERRAGFNCRRIREAL